jgi:D-tyrosyl-tRNA(Tyr) deacylase
MRTVVQRVSSARVEVNGKAVGSIDHGLLILVGVVPSDTKSDVTACVSKISGLRIFTDAEGKMNLSVVDVGGEVLVVSQFTLAADVRKGRRPSFIRAAGPAHAEPLIASFCADLESEGLQVEQGVFGAHMEVSLVNDGPVTIIIDTTDGSIV